MKPIKIISIVFTIILSAFLSTLFIVIGSSKPEKTNILIAGEWIRPNDSSSIEHFSCPGTGELVGDVWENYDGTYSGKSRYVRERFVSFENAYSDKDHAKTQIEKFIPGQ